MNTEILKNSKKLLAKLDEYCLKIDAIDDIYFMSKKIIIDINEKSHKNGQFAKKYLSWLKNGSTLELKYLLSELDYYNDRNLIHSNAMATLDTLHINFKYSN